MQPIVVFGAGGHAKVVLDIIERAALYRVAGVLDADPNLTGKRVLGYEVLGPDSAIGSLASGLHGFFVAVGDPFVRGKIAGEVCSVHPNLALVSAVHPAAVIGRGVSIGAGCAVMAGAIVNPDSRIGRGCVVNTGAQIDHDCSLGDFVSLMPGAILGGGVVMEDHSTLALGARVLHGRTIGAHALVGAGATVIEDVGAYQVVYGTPARRIRTRTAGERFL